MKTMMILGYPGTGKSTLNSMISNYVGRCKTFAVRAYVTYLKNSNDPIYEMLKPYAEKKEIIPAELIGVVFNDFLQTCSEQDFIILEGFPLNEEQIYICNDVLKNYSRCLDLIIYLQATKDAIFERVLNRKICKPCENKFKRGISYTSNDMICPTCNSTLELRSDDTVDYLEKRLIWHEASINEILCSYEGNKVIVDTTELEPYMVFEQIKGAINEC